MSADLERDLGWMTEWERGLASMTQQRVADAMRAMSTAVDDAVKLKLVLMGWMPPEFAGPLKEAVDSVLERPYCECGYKRQEEDNHLTACPLFDLSVARKATW